MYLQISQFNPKNELESKVINAVKKVLLEEDLECVSIALQYSQDNELKGIKIDDYYYDISSKKLHFDLSKECYQDINFLMNASIAMEDEMNALEKELRKIF